MMISGNCRRILYLTFVCLATFIGNWDEGVAQTEEANENIKIVDLRISVRKILVDPSPSEKNLRQAIRIADEIERQQKDLGESITDLIDTCYMRSRLYVALRDPRMAVDSAERALTLQDENVDENRKADYILMNYLACLYIGVDNFDGAEALAKRALALAEREIARDGKHDETKLLPILGTLERLYGKQARYALAEEIARRSLSILGKSHGPGHPDAIVKLNHVGGWLLAQEKFDEAGLLFDRALAAAEKFLAPDNADIVSILVNMGANYMAQRDFDKARLFFERGYAIANSPKYPNRVDAPLILNNLIGVHILEKNYDAAETVAILALSKAEKVWGADSPELIRFLKNFEDLLLATNRMEEAEKALIRADTILAKSRARK